MNLYSKDKLRKVSFFIFMAVLLAVPAQVCRANTPIPVPATVEVAQVDNSSYPQVTVYVRVLDAYGHRIENLPQAQFRVTEDGSPVAITQFSNVNHSVITTQILIDVSTSMSGNKLDGSREAALAFVDLLRPQDRLGIMIFSTQVASLQPFTSDKNALRDSIAWLDAAGNTSLYDAVILASEEFSQVSGRRSVLLLSDGKDNRSRNTFDDAVRAARSSQTPVYVIALGSATSFSNDGFDRKELEKIAEETGGTFYHAPSAYDLKRLYSQISLAMQDEYVLTYRSPRPTYDGTRREIVVTVGQTAGGGGYVEEHLLNIQSDPHVALIGAILLLALLILPASEQAMRRSVTSRKSKAGALFSTTRSDATSVGAGTPQKIPRPRQSSAAIRCNMCGNGLARSAKFCSKCGGSVRLPARCPRCNSYLGPKANFCGGCGVSMRVS